MRPVGVVALVVALVVAVAGARAARADEVPEERIEARLDAAEGGLRGVVTLRFSNVTAAPLQRAYVWLYPNRFAERPALDDVTFYWLYPSEWNPGWMRLGRVTADGAAVTARVVPQARAGAGTLVELTLPAPLAPGASLALRLPYAARVPERYGSFGCLSGECTLAGGFAPMLAQLDRAGWDLEAPPARVRHAGHLELAHEADVLVGGAFHPRAVVVTLDGAPSTHTTVRVSHKLWRTTRTHRGVTLEYLGRTAPPPADDAAHQTLAYTAEDWAKLSLDAAAQTLDLLAEVGAPVPAGETLTFVEAPLRVELATAQPGVVLLSDRLFRIFPARRFRKFHERELVRALLTEYFARRAPLAGAGARDQGVDAEVSASYLLDLFTVREYKKQEFAQNVLAPVAFVPAVDALIYAPQIAFAGAYFGAIADDDRFRDDVRRFAHARPRGSVYYEKLRDLLPPEAFAQAMRQVVLGEARLRPAAEAAANADLGWFFRQWGGRYPRVNYKLAGTSVADATGGGYTHTVRVDKQAIAGDPPPVEPVTVVAVDGDGAKHELRWDGAGAHASLDFGSASAKLRSITLDPQGRLVEASPPGSPDDPRYDDRTPPRWKFLYNSFGLLFGSGGDVSASADFSFRRIHDNRSALRLQAFTTDTTLFGGFVGLSRRFGPRITANRPIGAGSFGLGVQRLTDKLDHVPGSRVSLSAAFGEDDRLVLFEPLRLRGWTLGARWTMTRFDEDAYGANVNLDGAAPRGVILHTGSVSGDYTVIGTPRDGHTVVANVEGAVVFGDLRGSSQLLGAGGQGGLRGYGGADLLGRLRLTGHLEWRGMLTHDLNLNLGHFAWVRSVQAVAFVDAGAISGCTSYADVFAGDNLYASGGLGVRVFYDNFGVQPGMTGVEVSVPFATRPRQCLSGTRDLPSAPFFVYLTFVPPF